MRTSLARRTQPVVVLAAVACSLGFCGQAFAADFSGTWVRGDETIVIRENGTGVWSNSYTNQSVRLRWTKTDKPNTINFPISEKKNWDAELRDGGLFIKKGTTSGFLQFTKK